MKKLIAAVFSLAFVIILAVPAFAATDGVRVIDNAGLLSSSEEDKLQEMIDKIKEKYNFDIVILTENSIGGYTPTAYSDDFFDYGGYGYGPNRDGMLFLLSMENRDWYISTRGYGITAFTDYGIRSIGEVCVSSFSDGDYAEGFQRFLRQADDYLSEAKKGTPYDVDHPKRSFMEVAIAVAIVIAIALITAFIVVNSMKRSMKTARPQPEAGKYIRDGSFAVTAGNDMFLYSTVSRTPIAQTQSGGGGGGGGGSSTHISSSGATHGGGGGHF